MRTLPLNFDIRVYYYIYAYYAVRMIMYVKSQNV